MIEYVQLMWSMSGNGQMQGHWFFICLYCAVLLTYSFVGQLYIRSWPSVTGQLTSSGLKRFGFADTANESMVTSQVSYRYAVDQQDYTGHRLSPWVFITNKNASGLLKWHLSKVSIVANNGVTVYYNPRNPKKSYLLLPSKLGLWLTASNAYIPFIIYLFNYHI